jgi:hypothetical protein
MTSNILPWTGGAFAPLGPFLCPTTEEKNGLLPQSNLPFCPTTEESLKNARFDANLNEVRDKNALSKELWRVSKEWEIQSKLVF